MAVRLFEPIELRGLTIPNRIVVEPMTQFSADDGVAGDWHIMHLGQFAVSGAGMVLSESCYIEAIARNNPSCLSIYTDEQEAGVGRVCSFFRNRGSAAFGVQLCHGGRKASSRPHWEGGGKLGVDEGGYEAVAPSAIPIKEGWPAPRELSLTEIQAIIGMFADSAVRAARAGCHVVELHGAHGYLIHEFLSPITNRRTDKYGGSLENRMRFGLEIFEAVRAVWPDDKPLGIRISATDWVSGGWDLESSVIFAKRLDEMGCDFIDVSSGGLSPDQKIESGPGYQTGFAARIKSEVKMKVITVGQITEARQAETILRTGQADMIGLARIMLFNPRWPWQAAQELGADAIYAKQYERAHPSRWAIPGVSAPGNQSTQPVERGTAD
ncbi:oxidoreductase [Alphaproteobacteria bacterium HT1-32]|nr:oxidoreductase [Alphaproteobacteria bacterium HT1-32]